jgi:hypothetical protein
MASSIKSRVSSLTVKNSITFNPLNISGLTIWFDAMDPLNNKTPPSDGTLISTWYDKSGYSNNAVYNTSFDTFNGQGIVGGQITYKTSGLSSNKPALLFNKNWLTVTMSTEYNNANISIFIIAINIGGNGMFSSGRLLSIGNLSTNGIDRDESPIKFMYLGTRYNEGKFGLARHVGGYSFPMNDFVNTGINTNGSPYLYEAWTDGTKNYVFAQLGANRLPNPISSNINRDTETNLNLIFSNITIGKDNVMFTNTSGAKSVYTESLLNGYISEILVYNTVLSVSNREKIEGYLSWKWGLKNNLPTNHIYYNSFFNLVEATPPTPPPPTPLNSHFTTTVLLGSGVGNNSSIVFDFTAFTSNNPNISITSTIRLPSTAGTYTGTRWSGITNNAIFYYTITYTFTYTYNSSTSSSNFDIDTGIPQIPVASDFTFGTLIVDRHNNAIVPITNPGIPSNTRLVIVSQSSGIYDSSQLQWTSVTTNSNFYFTAKYENISDNTKFSTVSKEISISVPIPIPQFTIAIDPSDPTSVIATTTNRHSSYDFSQFSYSSGSYGGNYGNKNVLKFNNVNRSSLFYVVTYFWVSGKIGPISPQLSIYVP